MLVVDNAGMTAVRELTQAYGCTYAVEQKTGLSHARNRALEVATTDYILYFDDDALADPALVSNLLEELRARPDINAIGGWFSHYLLPPYPKWIEYQYRTPYRPADCDRLCRISSEDYLCGGLMAFRVDLLREVGGFNPAFGMAGLSMGYGEEDELQDRLRAREESIYFSPKLTMRHLVHPRKHSIRAQVNMAYEHGLVWSSLQAGGRLSFIGLLGRYARALYRQVPAALFKLFTRKGYYWQNAVVEVAGQITLATGLYVSKKDLTR